METLKADGVPWNLVSRFDFCIDRMWFLRSYFRLSWPLRSVWLVTFWVALHPKKKNHFFSSPWKTMKGYRDVNAMCEHASHSDREPVMSVHGGGWVSQRRGMRRQVAVTGSDSRYHWLPTSPALPQPLYGPVLHQDPEITQVLRDCLTP